MLFNTDAFPIVPFAAPCAVWIVVRTSACSVFVCEESDIAFAVLILLKLSLDTVFSVLKTASPCKDGVNILLRNGKSRGFFVLCLRHHFYLFFYGWEIGGNFLLIGNAFRRKLIVG